jgi:cation:H+ antiporter
MSFTTFAVLIVGVFCLVLGAEWLVRGASTLASRLGIAPIIIGLTVVAFGTSAPEMAVSIGGALSDKADVALGNVIGSSSFNILLILGLSAAVSGLSINQRLLRIDIPFLTVVSCIVYGLAWNGTIGRLEGAALFLGVIAYTGWLIVTARKGGITETPEVQAEYADSEKEIEGETNSKPLYFQVGLVLVGLVLLVLGSNLLVNAATKIASALGVSDLVIGLTVVAAGTSLPELATSVMAAIRGRRDIAVGNVVGSNLFNLLSVLGASAFVSKNGISVGDEALRLDFPVMLVATIVLIPICWNGFAIKKWEGALLVMFYGAYVAYLIMQAGKDGAPEFFRTMMLIVVPLVLMTFSVTGFRGWRRHREVPQG